MIHKSIRPFVYLSKYYKDPKRINNFIEMEIIEAYIHIYINTIYQMKYPVVAENIEKAATRLLEYL